MSLAAPCASCTTADEIAWMVRSHYGLAPPAPGRCDHHAVADRAELVALRERMWEDFAPATPEREATPPAARLAEAGPVADPASFVGEPQGEHPLDEVIVRWAAHQGVPASQFRAQRRAFVEGHLGFGPRVTPTDVLRAALPYFQQRGVLPPDRHRVVLVHGGRVGSHTVPVRLPGESLLVVPGDAGPLCAQYGMHEVGHVTEHANRRGTSLPERFGFEPVRSESIALLFEGLARRSEWWSDLGVGHLVDTAVLEHLQLENEWTILLGQVIVDSTATADDAWSLSPDELDAYRRQVDYWRALDAGRAIADGVQARLQDRFGESWWRADGPWEWMVATGFDEEAL